MLQLSPLQLVEYAFDGISVTPVEDYTPDAEYSSNLVFFPGKLALSAEVGQVLLKEEEKYSDYGVTLVIQVEPKTEKVAPYVVKATVRGVVRMHWIQATDLAEERRVRALVNGASLLYGAVREMVGNITSRSKYGQLLLPSLSFADLANRRPDEASLKPGDEPLNSIAFSKRTPRAKPKAKASA